MCLDITIYLYLLIQILCIFKLQDKHVIFKLIYFIGKSNWDTWDSATNNAIESIIQIKPAINQNIFNNYNNYPADMTVNDSSVTLLESAVDAAKLIL